MVLLVAISIKWKTINVNVKHMNPKLITMNITKTIKYEVSDPILLFDAILTTYVIEIKKIDKMVAFMHIK